MAGPFDYIKSFSSKEDFWELDGGKSYEPWIINRGLSFMKDCIFAANMMNQQYTLDKKMQHDFYFSFIPKAKRYGAWVKKEIDPNVQIIADYFCINNRLAEKYFSMLTDEQLQIIKQKMHKGGK